MAAKALAQFGIYCRRLGAWRHVSKKAGREYKNSRHCSTRRNSSKHRATSGSCLQSNPGSPPSLPSSPVKLLSRQLSCKRLAVPLFPQVALDNSYSSTSLYGHVAIPTRTMASSSTSAANKTSFLDAEPPSPNLVVSEASLKRLLVQEASLLHPGES